jgi:NodT family efflux transporter outer membrane factor (OMF) lipoprotein
MYLIRTLPPAAAAGLATVLAAGCMVGPDYVRPSVRVPVSYKEAGPWRPAAPMDQIPRGDWWKVYGDPELDALEAQVSISNQNVQAAAAQLRESQTLVQQARAGLFPSLSGSASVVRSESTVGGGQVPVSVGGPTVTTHNFSLSLPWEIDLWGRMRRQVEASQATAEASAADLESARLSAQATLAEDYFLLRIADAQKRLLDRTVAAYQRALQITRNRYAAGVVSKVDVFQAETQLKTTQAQAIDVGVQRAQLEHAIAVLIGRPPADFAVSAEEAPPAVPKIPAGVPSQLLERRPDIASAERQVAAANAQIGVAEAAFFPSLTLSASGGYQGSSFSNVLSAGNRFWSIGPALAGTLFDAGLRRAQTAQAIAAYDATVANYRQTVLTGFQEVEDNLAAQRILAREAGAQQAAVAAARRSVELSLNQYKAGTIDYLNVVTAQATQLSNEQAAVNLEGRRLAASVGLIKALGGGWQAPTGKIPEKPAARISSAATGTREPEKRGVRE